MGSRPVGEWSNRSWMHGVAPDRMGLRSMRLVARGRMKPTSFWRAMAGAGGQLREQRPCRNSDRLRPTNFSAPNVMEAAVRIYRTLATPEPIKDWSLTSLKDKLIKIGAKVV